MSENRVVSCQVVKTLHSDDIFSCFDSLFADYEQATFRQYQRLTKQHKPDMQEYGREQQKL